MRKTFIDDYRMFFYGLIKLISKKMFYRVILRFYKNRKFVGNKDEMIWRQVYSPLCFLDDEDLISLVTRLRDLNVACYFYEGSKKEEYADVYLNSLNELLKEVERRL